MVNTDNREFIMELSHDDYVMFSHKTGLPVVVEKHLSIDVILDDIKIDSFMFTKGPSRNWNLTTKTIRKLKFRLYTDKPEGIEWDKEKENGEA